MAFPTTRLRRLRGTPALRRLVRETEIAASDFVLPFFVRPGKGVKKAIGSMPGHFQYSVDELVKAVAPAAKAGVGGVILFGIPEAKDATATGAYDPDGIVQRAARSVK